MIKKILKNIDAVKFYAQGRKFYNDPYYTDVQNKTNLEISKKTTRSEILNFLLSLKSNPTNYLEIGVRNPAHNFDLINANTKYSVDPGVEFESNPVDFKMTSDEFFKKLSAGEILSKDIKFDVIFIDGLHLAEQADRDTINAFEYLHEDGFVVLHDCNPPTEWHARENYDYHNTPAHKYWNGTTWKAFLKWRCNSSVNSCCVDTDWGVGILSKKHSIGNSIESVNPFFEYYILDKNRQKELNLIDFEVFKRNFS